MCQGPQSSSMGVEEVVMGQNNFRRNMQEYVKQQEMINGLRYKEIHSLVEQNRCFTSSGLFTLSYCSHVFRWR